MILSNENEKYFMEQSSSSSSSSICIACSSNERSIVFIPCGHLIACVSCAHGLTSCPLCRADIKGTLRIFE